MTDNTQELDEILERTVTDASSSDWQSTDYDGIKAEAKQAIIDWHEQEIAEAVQTELKMALMMENPRGWLSTRLAQLEQEGKE